jgi:16S rRNA processing protein RimM
MSPPRTSSSPRLILVGRAAGAFGVKGDLRITTYTEHPATLLDYKTLLREDGGIALTLIDGRVAGVSLIARAREVATREQAEDLKGLKLYVERGSLPEPDEDEYYLADLVGLDARAPDGAPLGQVRSVHNFGAGDLLEIAPPDHGPTWWAPFTLAVVPEVRLAEGVIIVDRPPEIEAREEDRMAR